MPGRRPPPCHLDPLDFEAQPGHSTLSVVTTDVILSPPLPRQVCIIVPPQRLPRAHKSDSLFGSYPSNRHPLFKLAVAHVRRRPVVFFGLPFVGTLLAGSFVLSRLTQTRYDYNATRVQTLAEEDRLQLDHNRKRVDLREEYFRLSQPADVSGSLASPSQYGTQEAQEAKPKKTRKPVNWDWDGEQIRVPRLPGMAEWGTVDPREQSPEIGPRLV